MMMKDWRAHSWISLICALVLSVMFLMAAASKLSVPADFATGIGRYKVLHESTLNAPALMLPWWELAAAALFLHPKTRRSGAILTAGLIAVFVAATGQAIARELKIPCDCGLPGNGQAGWLHIAFLVFLLGLALGAARLRREPGQRGENSDFLPSSRAAIAP